MNVEEKIRRRLKPFVVEGRIREPAIRPLSVGGAGAFEIDVSPEQKAFAAGHLERDLKAALSDLAPFVSLRLAAIQ